MSVPADPWADVSAARLPAAGLAALAAVRDRPDVRVHPDGEAVWVTWPAGRAEVVRCLMPVYGVTFFARRGGRWHRFGSRLPTAAGPPDGDGRPLAALLVPARFAPTAPAGPVPPAPLRLVRGGGPKPATALLGPFAELARWAETATTMELAAVRAAWGGGRVAAVGDRLPPLPSAVRFWGDGVFVPLGFRPDPDLPPDVTRAAAGAAADDLVFLTAAATEIVSRAAFVPLTRAGVRLALHPPPPS